MKLYNIFEQLILEGNEDQAVNDAINNKYMVNIMYSDSPDEPPTKRYLQVYAYGLSKAGNRVIRAYQLGGNSKSGFDKSRWKLYRLDRISGWDPTNMKWYRPIQAYDVSVPEYKFRDKEMTKIFNSVTFDPKHFQR